MREYKRGIIGVTITAIALFSCATPRHGTILPKEDGSYESVSTAASEDKAYKFAENDAKSICADDKKRFVVVSQRSEYQGMDKNKKGDVGVGDIALAYFTHSSNKGDRRDDYKVTMKFKCI